MCIIIISCFNGCVKDSCTHTYSYTWFEPLYKTTAEVRDNIKTSTARAIKVPGKLFVIGKYIFLNEVNKGIHIINNSNPAAPVNAGFIDIPGNIDIAVKGNTLYADLYSDLVTLDISNPLNVVKKKIIDNVFPHRRYYGFNSDSLKIIYDWTRHDTTITADCSQNGWIGYNRGGIYQVTDNQLFYSSAASNAGFIGGSPSGIAGSMARFALMNNYLYTVGDAELKVINIAEVNDPKVTNTIALNWGIETIYPFKDKLFIGSNTGMFIFNTTNPYQPAQEGQFTHARVCDPVIADSNYAFITLRNGSQCAGFINELEIVDISNLSSPVLLKKFDMTNPHGLSKDGKLLFICDGKDGLKIFDASDITNLKLVKQFKDIETFDVIAWNGLAIVVAADGLYQFNYVDNKDIKLLSKISILQ
ncbi:LVIVD repeat-containing protein [Ferruginibacter sp.]|uniref:LVIVD repeat-containing protein n=1 Tax=Ferruginibacter sp. TaxID=1940288 RepID=UPI0019BA7335|nr:hypothetical protein [Ferruginibacter sp.]MBC7627840.1 hypothetical protein [Ferruginibacter sp.]